MSDTLRYTRSLLAELGARLSPEPLPLPGIPAAIGELRPSDQGQVATTPVPFSFFLCTAAQMYLLGEVPRADGPPLPITLLSVAIGVIARSGSRLEPFMQPVHGHVVCLPELLGQQIAVDRYRGVGITPIFAGDATQPRGAILEAQGHALVNLIEETRESVYLGWHDAAGVSGHRLLVDGGLRPTESVLKLGSWVGIRRALSLTALEEQAALGLPPGAASVPFGYAATGAYWFTRTLPNARADSAEGLLRMDCAIVDNEHVASKIGALTQAVYHERFPVVEAGDLTAVPLYPLSRGTAYLATFIAQPQAVIEAL